ncbi:phosphoribosylformylglycinamidine cyclo-ligase [Streptomonospora halophila]|uniref:Phosphoribosylformylglycinamidine cyclo-ligase n=1 Tax=Streptomonospora halophila TaxID=427369 RepID=A0ABP9GD36_9ACTN
MAEGANSTPAYASAGVDIAAGDRAVALMKEHVGRARRPEQVADPSGFAGLFRLDTSRYRSPLLATSTDGVGTKVMIAQRCDRHDTVGLDLVGMVVDDLVVCGAEPLFMTDYIACGRVVPERVAELVKGIAEGCRQAGCALSGGETAEHPDAMRPDEYDLAGAGTGIVEEDAVLGPQRVREGDAVIAMASSGLHSNGYSLVRRVVDEAALRLDARVPELGTELGEELLKPTRIYAQDCLALAGAVEVHAFAHITGGGLAANLARSLPEGLDAVVDRATWSPPAVFPFVAERGAVGPADMEATFNMGVGMAALVPSASAQRALALLEERGVPAWHAGSVVAGSGKARLEGAYA